MRRRSTAEVDSFPLPLTLLQARLVRACTHCFTNSPHAHGVACSDFTAACKPHMHSQQAALVNVVGQGKL